MRRKVTFSTDDLKPDNRLVYDVVRDLGIHTLRVRYYGGDDEDFAYWEEGRSDERTFSAAQIIQITQNGPLGERGRERWAGAWYDGDEAEEDEAATRARWIEDALDSLAYDFAWLLFGRGFGTGEGSIEGHFTVDLQSGQIIADPQTGDDYLVGERPNGEPFLWRRSAIPAQLDNPDFADADNWERFNDTNPFEDEVADNWERFDDTDPFEDEVEDQFRPVTFSEMAHPWYHAQRSARLFGGVAEDYLEIHSWFDESKAFLPDLRHRALRHHSEGIFLCERIFGVTIQNSDGKAVPTRAVGEQHVQDDLGWIPTVKDWIIHLEVQPWMTQTRFRPTAGRAASGEQTAPAQTTSEPAVSDQVTGEVRSND